MPTETTSSPIVAQGKTKGAIGQLRGLPPDQLIVLTGPSGWLTVKPDQQVNRWSIVLQQYDFFVIVSTRNIKIEREVTLPSLDHTIAFDLSIHMDLSVFDPEVFVRSWPMGQIDDPVYDELHARLAETVQTFSASEIHQLRIVLRNLSSEVSNFKTISDCVAINRLSVDVSIDDDGMEILGGLRMQELAERYGDAVLLAMAQQTNDPEKRKDYETFYRQLRAHREETHDINRKRIDYYAKWVRENFQDDPMYSRKLLQDENLRTMILPVLEKLPSTTFAAASVVDNLLPPGTPASSPPLSQLHDEEKEHKQNMKAEQD